MSKKQFAIVLVVSFVGGIIGGLISGEIFISNDVYAKNVLQSKIIEANQFKVIDVNGKMRATFGIVKGGTDPALDLMPDDESSNRIQISPTVGLFITKNDSKSQLTSDGVFFYDDVLETELNSFGLNIRHHKKSATLQDMFGKPLLQVGLIGQGSYPGIRLCDSSQRDRLIINLLDSGEPFISLNDDFMKTRAILGTIGLKNYLTGSVETRAPSSLVLFNESGNVVWKAP